MKKIIFIPAVVLITSLALGQSKNEMPFTTTSPEASKLLHEALVAWGDGNGEEATKLAKESIVKDPEFGMGYMYSSAGGNEIWKQNLAKAEGLKLSADEKMILAGLKARLDNKSTREFFGPVLTKYPKDNYLHLVAMVNSDSKYRVEIGEALVKRSPKFAPGYNILGYGYMDEKEMSKAQSCFDKYIALRPDLGNAYDSKGDYMMRAGNFKDAIPLFEKAASMGLTNSTIKARRANIRVRNPNLSENDITEIKRVIGASIEEFKKGNIDGYLGYQSDQAVEIFANQMSNIGAGNIRQRLKGIFKSGSYTKFESTIKSVEGLGPIALAWGKMDWIFKPNQSNADPENHRNWIIILRRQDDGSWRILTSLLAMMTQNESADDETNIRKVVARWNALAKPGELMQESDLDKFAELYANQAIEILPGGRSNVGIGNLKARWSGFVGMKWVSNSLLPHGLEIVGNKAVRWGTWVQSGTPKGSEQVNNSDFAWVMIMTKEKDNAWRILTLHWTEN